MSEEEPTKKSFFKQMLSFYFTNSWYSFFNISYFLFFLYAAIFYFDNVILAIKFIFYTFQLSTPLLGISYLFWGVTFIISLIIPFSVSIYAIFIYHNLWEKTSLQKKQKFISSILVFILTIFVIVTMSDLIKFVAKQEPLIDFIQTHNLSYRLVTK